MRIYLAGKVNKHGWREGIVGDSLESYENTKADYNFEKMLSRGVGDMMGGHDYCGPFLIELER